MYVAKPPPEVVNLTVNVTSDPDSNCPTSIKFYCTASYVKVLNWYFNKENLLSYTLDGTSDVDLCQDPKHEQHKEGLTDFCNNGGSVKIDNSSRHKILRGWYNITSHLQGTGSYIRKFSNVSCGGTNVNSTVNLDKHIPSCNPENLTLTSNISAYADEGKCVGKVEFMCIGTNVEFFQWTYDNNRPFTDFVSISNFRSDLNSSLLNMQCTAKFDTNNTLPNSFNFQSVCVGDLSDRRSANWSTIGCNSSVGYKQIDTSCKF